MELILSYLPFRKLALERDLSRKEIEAATGINKNTIGRLYNDIDVSINTIKTICEFFECDISDIVEFITPDEYARRIRKR